MVSKRIAIRFMCLCLALTSSEFVFAQQSKGRPIFDRLEAIVGDTLITYCEIEVEARIALARRQRPEAAYGQISAALHEAVREYLINQYIVIAEANVLQIFSLEEEEIEEQLNQFKQKFPSEAAYRVFLRRISISEENLRDIMARNLRVEKFLDYRVKSEVYVSPAEVSDYYAANLSRFGAQSFSEVKGVIQGFLELQKQARIKKEWLARLRKTQQIGVMQFGESQKPTCRLP